MAFPFFRRPSPKPGPVLRPVSSKPATQPKPTPKPGILGEKGYRSFVQMRESARKAPYKSYSKLSAKKLGKQQRVDLINKWRTESKRSHGLSTTDFSRLINKKKKEMAWASPTKKKELRVEIETMEAMKKGF